MSDWQVGDLALCVRDPFTPSNLTRAGRLYEVELVWINPNDNGEALDFVGQYNGEDGGDFWGHNSERFVKATPPAADEFDRETIALMNRVEQPA